MEFGLLETFSASNVAYFCEHLGRTNDMDTIECVTFRYTIRVKWKPGFIDDYAFSSREHAFSILPGVCFRLSEESASRLCW